MEEKYEYYVIVNSITKEYYEGLEGSDRITYKWIYKYCKLLKDAYMFGTRKEANEEIRENLQRDDLKVKKIKVSYLISK